MAPSMLIFNDSCQSREHLISSIQKVMTGFELSYMNSVEALAAHSESASGLILLLLAKLEARHVQAIKLLQEARRCPLMVFADDADPKLIKQLIDFGVSVVIHGSFDATRLPTLCAIANARFGAHQKLYGELEEARSRLADRKLLDRAKGLLMSHRKLSEPEAYALLRKQAMDKGLRLGVVARQVIDTLELLELAVGQPKAFEQRKVTHLTNGKPANF